MHLDRIEISNFRSIESATIKFEPRCRILIGKNEAGKSNLLQACALLDPNSSVAPSDLRETRDDDLPVEKGYVRFIFRMSAGDIALVKSQWRQRCVGDVPLCEKGGKRFSAPDFAAEFTEWLLRVDLPEGKRIHSYWDKSSYKIEPGWLLSSKGADLAQIYAALNLKRAPGNPRLLVHSSKISEAFHDRFEDATIEAVSAEISHISDAIATPQVPTCVHWKYADENLLPQSIGIDRFRDDPMSCQPLRAMFILAGETDIAGAIGRAVERPNGLKNLLTRVARLTTSHVRARWKELSSVEIVLSPNGTQIDAAVKDAFNEFAFHRRSDGFKRFVSFLILVSARSAANDMSEVLFIQDEPDLGLHPTGSKSLLTELVALSKSNYVLISTHSIFMVDKERIDRHYIVEKEEEVTAVSTVDRSQIQDEEVLYNALGYSILELIRPENLIFEGWRDKRLFQTQVARRGAAEQFLRDKLKHSLGVTHAMGVKDIQKVVTMFDAIDRRSIAVTDSDPVAVQKQRVFAQERPDALWLRYDELVGMEAVLTGEDFITPSRLRSALSEVLTRFGVGSPVPVSLFPEKFGAAVVALAQSFLNSLASPTFEVKDALNSWKSEIFENLKGDQIRSEYQGVVSGLAKKLGYTTGSADDDV